MIIKVNNIDISSRLLSFKTLNEMNSDSLLIGNAVCKKLELKLDNHDGELTPLLDYPFFVSYSENKALGKFNVYEKPEKYTGELSLTLFDDMYSFNPRYDTNLNYLEGVTIAQQIDEMSNITGVSIDKSELSESVLNKLITWYDNTISMRNYLGWIAELDGCNVFIGENGVCIFRSLANAVYNTIDVETYEKGELVVITRICFDDGVLKLEAGNNVGNTMYLSSNNAYVDSKTDLSTLLAKYQGLSFYSVKDVKMANIANLFLTDLVNYNNEFIFMPLSVDEVYSGGQYSIATVNGEVNTINQEIVINKIDPSTKIRRLKTIVDQNSQSLQIISQDVDDNKEQIAQLTISNKEIKSEVSKKVGDDEIISKINQSAEEIKIQAAKLTLEGIITANGNVKILEDGSIVVNNGTFTGDVVGASFYCENTSTYTYTVDDIDAMADLYFSEVPPTKEQLARYDINQNGHIDSQDGLIIQKLLQGKYGSTNGVATFTDTTSINVDGFGKLVLERKLNGTTITRTEYNSGSINKIGGSITIDGEPVITEISGTIARFG